MKKVQMYMLSSIKSYNVRFCEACAHFNYCEVTILTHKGIFWLRNIAV